MASPPKPPLLGAPSTRAMPTCCVHVHMFCAGTCCECMLRVHAASAMWSWTSVLVLAPAASAHYSGIDRQL